MSCEKFRLLFDNQLHSTEMTASPIGLTEPVGLLTEQRSRVFRSHQSVNASGQIVQNLQIESPDRTFAADCFAIAQHNLDGDDTVRLRLFDELGLQGNVTYDSGHEGAGVLIPFGIWQPGVNYWGETYNPSGLDRITPLWFEPVPWRSALVTITGRNVAGYLDIGMMMLGLSVRPEKNFNWGAEIINDPDMTISYTNGGSSVTEGGMGGHREMRLDLSSASDADRNKIEQAGQQFAGRPMLVSAYPEDSDIARRINHTMIAKIKPKSRWQHSGVNKNKHTMYFLGC